MKILVVIDMQNDFIRGSLSNPAAEAIVPKIKERIEAARENKENGSLYSGYSRCRLSRNP